MPISVVLFDLGKTLFHFEGDLCSVYPEMDLKLSEALNSLGYRLDTAAFVADFIKMAKDADQLGKKAWIEIPTFDIVNTVLKKYGYPEPPEDHIRQALKEYYAISQACWKLELDAVPMLEELKRQGYRLGVISNASDSADVMQLLNRDNLSEFFEKVWISSSVGVCKPHPVIFNLALEFFQTPAQDMAFVGDTLAADIAGAKKAGMQSIWITRRAERPENLALQAEIIPKHKIQTLAELPNLLKSDNK